MSCVSSCYCGVLGGLPTLTPPTSGSVQISDPVFKCLGWCDLTVDFCHLPSLLASRSHDSGGSSHLESLSTCLDNPPFAECPLLIIHFDSCHNEFGVMDQWVQGRRCRRATFPTMSTPFFIFATQPPADVQMSLRSSGWASPCAKWVFSQIVFGKPIWILHCASKYFAACPWGFWGCLLFFRSISRKKKSCIWELLPCRLLTVHRLPLCVKCMKCEKRVCLKTHSSSDKARFGYHSSLHGQFSVLLPRICICLHIYCLIILWKVKMDK